ncbi:substrate-binding domain-containing protein [Primorskyibacter flagellatus]|uniref:Monosaccharide ABC transporter substrate-binding protein, CUT2 family n=1 Tax=Primorskyibacter flagellatus TaxID=1387277 RepID=A0A1W2EAA9_9RHOB|nr:substrate-binding domain-containing protein [Primorskyibacter flagellatus]SMD06497.1 monosaccharide ABC transporter substrate-binding protein, CUT2 family [Primorskyibacter flagellatus]
MSITRRTIIKIAAAGAMISLAAPAIAQEGGAKIGVAIPAATHGWTGGLNYHTERTIAAMEAAFPQIEFVLTTAGDVQSQVNNIEDMVAQGINALVILPMESDPLTEPVKAAKARGIFITTVDRGLSEEGVEDLYVGGNNAQYGTIAAEYFKDKLPDGGKIVVMRGIPTAIDNIRIDAFNAALEGSGIEVLDMQYGNWNPDKGFELMQDYLSRFEQIDGVWAGDDDAALGAKAAIEQSGRADDMVLLGGSGMNTVIKMIMDGDALIDADIFYPPTLIVPAIEITTMRYATQAPIQGRYELDSPLITKENAVDFYFPDSPY